MAKKELKYIYCFAYYNLDSPSVRYRLKYPLDYAKENVGIKGDLVIPGYGLKQLTRFIQCYLAALLRPKKNTIVIVQRIRSKFIYATLLKLLVLSRRTNTVYDLDDADYLTYNSKTIHFFAQNCSYIAAGSAEIANYFKPFNKNIIHITSPTPSLDINKGKRNKTLTIGWVGGFRWGHRDSLFELFFPAIKKLNFNCKLSIVGITRAHHRKEVEDYFSDCNHVSLEMPESINWRNEKEIQKHIAAFDIGIATLSKNLIQQSKSGIKAKQYLNNGVPVLCNNLPENNNVVKNEVNGYYCNSANEFAEAITRIAQMSDKEYALLSSHAKQSAQAFSHSKWLEDMDQILSNLT